MDSRLLLLFWTSTAEVALTHKVVSRRDYSFLLLRIMILMRQLKVY